MLKNSIVFIWSCQRKNLIALMNLSKEQKKLRRSLIEGRNFWVTMQEFPKKAWAEMLQCTFAFLRVFRFDSCEIWEWKPRIGEEKLLPWGEQFRWWHTLCAVAERWFVKDVVQRGRKQEGGEVREDGRVAQLVTFEMIKQINKEKREARRKVSWTT